MKQDRFLIAILAGIGVLIALSLFLFFTRRTALAYLPEDTPESIVQNYALALYQRDYDRAYAYLAEGKNRPDRMTFEQMLISSQQDISTASLIVSPGVINGQSASVSLTVRRNVGGLFGRLTHETQTAQLTLQSGRWKLTWMPYPYWGWDWYNTPAEIKPALPGA